TRSCSGCGRRFSFPTWRGCSGLQPSRSVRPRWLPRGVWAMARGSACSAIWAAKAGRSRGLGGSRCFDLAPGWASIAGSGAGSVGGAGTGQEGGRGRGRRHAGIAVDWVDIAGRQHRVRTESLARLLEALPDVATPGGVPPLVTAEVDKHVGLAGLSLSADTPAELALEDGNVLPPVLRADSPALP